MRDSPDLAVVGDDQHGCALLVGLLVEQLEDLDAGVEVQLSCGLVREQDRIARSEGPRDRDPLLLSTRELVREVLHPLVQSDPAEHVASDLAGLIAAAGTSAPNSTFSSAVRAGKRLKVWKMKLTVWRRKRKSSVREALVMSCPAIRMVPSVGESRAPIMLSSVVLPLPEGPRTTVNSPRSTLSVARSSAVTVSSPTR